MSPRRSHLVLAALAAGVAVAGCGDSGTARSTALVDTSKKPPYINALDVDPRDGTLLMTTNRGFFHVDPRDDSVERIKGKVTDKGKSSPVGTFLAITAIGPGKLLGSGHPDLKGTGLPQFLGFLRSDDGGKSWRVISRLGLADLHVIRPLHGRLYAFDAVLGAMLVSKDGGHQWAERFTPQGLMLDFVVDPEDPSYLLALNADQIFRSTDEGETWRPLGPSAAARLAWPAPDSLLRANSDGTVQRSDDRGESWEDIGRLDGEPWRLHALDAKHLYAALADGTIEETKDGGRTWEKVFEP
jgi:photosystem II stability/assembly factor-like uncharacterized protein